MFNERRRLAEWFTHTLKGEGGIIDRAVKGQLDFNPACLPTFPDPEKGIDIYHYPDGDVLFTRNRNLQKANIDYMNARLIVMGANLLEEKTTPKVFEQQTRAVLQAGEDNLFFAGYTEYEHLYWRTGVDNRLQQSVSVSHMPRKLSPTVTTIAIHRYALDWAGDLIYGEIILREPTITDGLKMKSYREDPVFLIFIPDCVLATTYGPGPEVLGQLTYDQLAKIGIHAHLKNEPHKATLALVVDNISFTLTLGKLLRPNYVDLLFSPSEEWTTYSGISVATIPQVALN